MLRVRTCWRRRTAPALALLTGMLVARSVHATDTIHFPAVENVTAVLVDRINAETVRIDVAAWYLSERALSIALVNRFNAGVAVRVIGDRVAIFESDPFTRREFYWLASQGIPIRVRYEPTWFPQIVHWKAMVFAGQGAVAFGSANFTPFELAPVSSTNYKDETVLVSDDAAVVNAFRTQFDRMWSDTAVEPESFTPRPPYFKDWDGACALESACADYRTLYPSPPPMVVDTRRLEPDHPSPRDLVWSQGPAFNQRLIEEIARETTRVDLVAYRLTVGSVTDALIRRFQEGVPTRVIVDPEQYTSRAWPEYWLTHASVDRLWAAGVPIKQRRHAGLTHMKMLVTSQVATNASSNIAANWQRDHNYFVPAATKPQVHRAMQQRFDSMWADESGFEPFAPLPPDSPVPVSPEADASAVPTDTVLVWRRAPFATSYDVYFGVSPSTMTLVATIPAQLVESPPLTYSWRPPPLVRDTSYSWRVVSRTLAGLTAAGPTRQFRTPSVPKDVMVNFGPGGGLWRYRNGQPWTQVHSLSPKAMVAGDIDGNGIDELVMDFNSGGGLWILWNNTSWSQLHVASAVAMTIADLNGNGRADVIFHFEGVGIYIWYDGSVWSFLHPYAPDLMVAANIDAMSGDDLIVSFPGRGVWAYRNASHWSRLHELNPQFIVAGQLDGQGGADLVLSYPPYGIWQYANDDAWSQIHSLNPTQVVAGDLDVRGPEDLVLDFGTGGGIWVRLNGTSWSRVHEASSERIAVADVDGAGPDEVLIDFGAAAGLWMLNRLSQWEPVHPLSPVDLRAITLR